MSANEPQPSHASDVPPAVFTRDRVRAVDRAAIEEYHIPGIVLMENAARQLADQAAAMLDTKGRGLILCGGGNNGGDGLAAARHLHNRGYGVTIVLLKPPSDYSGDAATNLRVCQAMGQALGLAIVEAAEDPVGILGEVGEHDLILDGLLGTGIDRAVREPLAGVIEWINGRSEPVLAIDIPSGLDCDRGVPLGSAVRATATVTFVGWKQGFLEPEARQYTGTITVADIGAPRAVVEAHRLPTGASEAPGS